MELNLRLLDTEGVGTVLPRNVDNYKYLQWTLRDILDDLNLHQQPCEYLRPRSGHMVSRLLNLLERGILGESLFLDFSDLCFSLKYLV
jgi:hypothetical protein